MRQPPVPPTELWAFSAPPTLGLTVTSLADGIAKIIKASLTLVGVVALGFLVYGGFKYITAHGEDRAIGEAKQTMTQAIVGIVAIGIAYAVVEFVTFALD